MTPWGAVRLIHSGAVFDTPSMPHCEALGSPDPDGMFTAIDRAGDRHEFHLSAVKTFYGCRDPACPVCHE